MSQEDPRREDVTWSTPYCCHYCRQRGSRVHATIRVFAGVAGYGGGWSACDAHRSDAITAAMDSFLHGKLLAEGFTVTALLVEADEEGYPKMTRRLFTAQRRSDAEPSAPSWQGSSR